MEMKTGVQVFSIYVKQHNEKNNEAFNPLVEK